jgi:multiple sugar transport system permease protein
VHRGPAPHLQGHAQALDVNIFNGYNIIEWQYLFAASIFAIIPVVILFILIEKNLVSGLAAGGVKG